MALINPPQKIIIADSNSAALSSDLRGSKQSLAVEIVDASGNQITSFGSSTVTANQGTANTAANRWPIELYNSDATTNSLSTGGQIGQKVQIVGDGNKFVGGIDAHNAAITGNPVLIAAQGASSAPTAVTTGNIARLWADLNGRLHITGDGSMSPLLAQGDIAAASTDSGNPLKIGGVFVTSVPTLTTGQRGNAVLDNNGRIETTIRPANNSVTNTAASGSAVTLTLAAPGAGLFHHICYLSIVLYAAAAITGGATPILVTSTNLVGSNVWTFPTAQAIGTSYEYRVEPTTPIRSSVANTATTIVCPATTSVIWRVNVFYYTSPQA